MRWLKRDLLNSIAIGILFFLVFITWIFIQVGNAQPVYTPTGGPVKGIPTVNTTAVVQDQLKQQDDKLQKDNSFPWIILNDVGSSIGTILVAAAALIAAWLGWMQWLKTHQSEQEKRGEEQKQWREDHLSEQEKRAEERFQKVVEGFGGDNEGTKVGAAILLRTFLRPGYEQFYAQTFDLAVANLRLPRTPDASEDPDGVPYQPKDQESPLPLTTLSQALITVFKQSFHLARKEIEKQKPLGLDEDEKDRWYESHIRLLDASRIHLDNAFLRYADLKYVQMRDASLINATFRKANLSHAYLTNANLTNANLRKANLSGARFRDAYLSHAHLDGANLRGAYLKGAHLNEADLTNADLSEADLRGADLRGVKMNNETDLRGTKLQGAKYNTKKIHEKDAQGKLVTVEPTQWPQGFDHDGAVDVDSLLFNFTQINENIRYNKTYTNITTLPQTGIAVDARTTVTVGNIAEFAYPLAQFIEQTHPDYIIACDRGARMIAFAVHMMYGQLYGSLPTQDHRINFRKISRKVPVEAVKATLKSDVERMLATIETPTVLIIDDWVHTGETRELVQKVLSELSGGKVNVLFGVMRGGGADVTGSSDSVAMSEWHDNVDLIGVDYDANTLTPHSVGSPSAIAYRRKAFANIQQFVQNLGFAASRNRNVAQKG